MYDIFCPICLFYLNESSKLLSPEVLHLSVLNFLRKSTLHHIFKYIVKTYPKYIELRKLPNYENVVNTKLLYTYC